MCSTKRIVSLVLVLFLIFSNGISSTAKTKTMYTKKAITIKCNNKKVVVPQYHKLKVKLTKKRICISEQMVVDFKKTINDTNPLTIIIEEEEVPKASFPEPTWYVKWKVPSKTYVKVGDNKASIKTKHLTKKKPKGVIKKIPCNTCKSYMSYRTITCTSSPQYKMQHRRAYTDEATGVRMVDGRYCIAVGPKVASRIGTKLELIYASGKRIPAIVGDQKGNTIDGYRHPDGSAVEFIVDYRNLPRRARLMGDMSVLRKFRGDIVAIKVFKNRKEQ